MQNRQTSIEQPRSYLLMHHPMWLLGCILLVLVLVPPLQADEYLPRDARVSSESMRHSAVTLDEAIRQAIVSANGDIDHQHMHLVLGFSTGHFAQDPLGAEAARGIAIQCVRDLLIRGDKLSVYAWELHLWQHPQVGKNPIVVETDDAADKTKLQDLFPLTPQTGSRGGHDTEQALVEIAERLDEDSSAVIVLLTNSGASVGRKDQQVIGADNPDYQLLLSQWKRVSQVSQTGASLVLPYTIVSEGKAVRLRSLDAVIMTHVAFAGEAITSGTRTTHLFVKHAATQRKQASSPWGIAMLLISVVLAGLVIFTRFAPRGGIVLSVNGQNFDLSSVSDGGEICHLAGPRFAGVCDRTVMVLSADHEIPPWRLARFVKQHGKVQVVDDTLKLYSLNGVVLSGGVSLPIGEKCRLVFQGEWSPDPAFPSRPVRVEVDAEAMRATPQARRG